MGVNEETIKSTINALVKGINDETNRKYTDIIKNFEQMFGEKIDPEDYNVLIDFNLFKIERASLKSYLESLGKTVNEKVLFVYQNYDFINNHLGSGLINELYGSCCSIDVSRWLIGKYLKHQYGEISCEAITREQRYAYWVPKAGTMEEWFAHIDGIYTLYWGRPTQYIETRNKLISRCNEYNQSWEKKAYDILCETVISMYDIDDKFGFKFSKKYGVETYKITQDIVLIDFVMKELKNENIKEQNDNISNAVLDFIKKINFEKGEVT